MLLMNNVHLILAYTFNNFHDTIIKYTNFVWGKCTSVGHVMSDHLYTSFTFINVMQTEGKYKKVYKKPNKICERNL